ncbi:MAG TPA: hypothetical protein VNO52_15120, partial [Methylomirabilota bacterium]|nr:hypothetical protein [Methylomirabilota bacterium]
MKQIRAIILLIALLVACHSPAEPLRVAWCRLGAAGAEPEATANAEAERAQWRQVAEAARKLDPDVLIVAGLRHRGAAAALAGALRPGLWQVAVCSTFPASADAPVRQVAILARHPAVAAWTEAWRGAAPADLPGGFAFAAFRHGSETVGVFALEWEPWGASRLSAFNTSAHEMAARYVLHHADWVTDRITNGPAGLLVTGWQAGRMNPDHPLARTLASGGFQEAQVRGRDAVRAAEERQATAFAFTRKGELVDWVQRPGRAGRNVTWLQGELVALPDAAGTTT